MESLFKSGVRSFLESSYIDFIEYGNTFIFPEYDFQLELIPAESRNSYSGVISCSKVSEAETTTGLSQCGSSSYTAGTDSTFSKELPGDILFLFEDRWWAARELVQERILARLERFRSVFARKCRVLSGRGDQQLGERVREFLQRYHSYSSAKCRYRYALEHEGEIVAVATFSEGRPMVRKMEQPLLNVPKEEQQNADILIFDSYEWVRYASLPGVRVVGGMGKLLNAFIDERFTRIEPGTPLEIMTYSDTEWSNGDVYTKLGFSYAGERPPVEYHVHKKTYQRFNHRLYEKELQNGALPSDFYTIQNLGSKKFLLQII
jgi:hypothetical protein